MNRQLARRLPLLGKWVRKLEALEEKYARLKKQRDDLKAQLTQVKAGLEALKREREERRARLHKLECRLPVPPEPLRSCVHGTSDEVTFLSYGYEIASSIKQLLGAEGLQFDSFARILDFGCGCGRVLRFFEQRPRVLPAIRYRYRRGGYLLVQTSSREACHFHCERRSAAAKLRGQYLRFHLRYLGLHPPARSVRDFMA